ncbi:MAG: HNH endonuclease [Acidimicrobiia bacterium]
MRATRPWAVIAVLVTLVACGLEVEVPPPPSAGTPGPDELARPRVAAHDPTRGRYERDAWQPHGWEDSDGDGCNTREEVLLAEGRAVQVGAGCKIASGEWTDRYTGRQVTSPAQLQIDHLVALSDAHASGGWAWPADRKVAFANDLRDPDELNAVWGPENERKADYGPDRWLPPNPTARCWYVSAYARIKARWDLTVTPAQWAAMEVVWADCGGAQ